jgi:hypothetical protein
MDRKRLITIMLISAAGLLLTWWSLQTGAGHAAPAGPPLTPVPSEVDDMVDWIPNSPQASVQRIQTVTLAPLLDDVMEDKWQVHLDEVFYNRPGGGYIRLPADACESANAGVIVGTVAKTCTITDTLLQIPSDFDVYDWITVTYDTRTRAVRYRNVVTMTTVVQTNGDPYEPLMSTLVYIRQFVPGRNDIETYISRCQTIPPANQSSEGNWVRWIKNTNSFTGSVVLHEPLFGSDLTITQFLMSPQTPQFGQRAYFTAVIQNIGVITAWRFYAVELYLKRDYDPAPQNASDHAGGWNTYGFDAMFSGWEQPPLGPGQIHTVTTAITIPLPGTFKAYAQVDTAYTDPNLYAWYGRNPEGYGTPPFTEEQNVLVSQPFTVKGSTSYLPLVSRNSSR